MLKRSRKQSFLAITLGALSAIAFGACAPANSQKITSLPNGQISFGQNGYPAANAANLTPLYGNYTSYMVQTNPYGGATRNFNITAQVRDLQSTNTPPPVDTAGYTIQGTFLRLDTTFAPAGGTAITFSTYLKVMQSSSSSYVMVSNIIPNSSPYSEIYGSPFQIELSFSLGYGSGGQLVPTQARIAIRECVLDWAESCSNLADGLSFGDLVKR